MSLAGQVPGPDHCDGRAGGGQGLCTGLAAGVCSLYPLKRKPLLEKRQLLATCPCVSHPVLVAGVSHQLGRPRVKCGLLRTERSPTCPHSQPGRS
ncbi:presequence translocase associated motor 16 [Homo sapiens]|uniref:Presequence translocase associated motor 16 n=1 Tax=Homo sapiens TaxID=9606 RepID=I3L1K9_HUMAN|nr:presequence translocase associated motor 16 [Homo sapiens]KAI4053269.1 presequence translocase associated motor 16 [Homo sapiens]